MSMCAGCKHAADLTASNLTRPGDYVCRLRVPHPCLYPHSCTCQHGGKPPVPVGPNR